MHIQHVGHGLCLWVHSLLDRRRLVTLNPSCTARNNWKKSHKIQKTVKSRSLGTQEVGKDLQYPCHALIEPLLCVIKFIFLPQKPASNTPGIQSFSQIYSKGVLLLPGNHTQPQVGEALLSTGGGHTQHQNYPGSFPRDLIFSLNTKVPLGYKLMFVYLLENPLSASLSVMPGAWKCWICPPENTHTNISPGKPWKKNAAFSVDGCWWQSHYFRITMSKKIQTISPEI